VRFRVIGIAVVCLAVASAVAYTRWQATGRQEMQAVTERVAAAVARFDRDALTAEPLLQAHSGTADLLLRHSPDIAAGYRVTVGRNGVDGFHLMPDSVTHLGLIKTASGVLYLGFRSERTGGQAEFVTAVFTSLPAR
jgi:hypothetical protein